MVFRIYVEKKNGLDHGASALKKDLKELLGITGIEELRMFNRYDVENISEELFSASVKTVFSEPQTDNTYTECPVGDVVFAVEYLPGQFDARAASAAECIQIISKGERPDVKTATIYVINGNISEEEVQSIKKYVINPV
ncbi:MAG: phosphoribosylformylglycinamidine synthase, partial [Clostridia bacterium]|nr:phosphoribosylformylglycinamidine synthase [Clostridia bacterium]